MNPENKTHNPNTTNDLPNHINSTLPTVCPKSAAHNSNTQKAQPPELPTTILEQDIPLAQAILAIDQLPIDSSTKISLIKELATKLTESTEPESPEDSPNE